MKPEFLANTLAVMLETQLVVRPTKFALESQTLQGDYFESWQGLKNELHARNLSRHGADEQVVRGRRRVGARHARREVGVS